MTSTARKSHWRRRRCPSSRSGHHRSGDIGVCSCSHRNAPTACSVSRASRRLLKKLRCVPGTEASVTAASPAEAGVPRRSKASAAARASGPIAASKSSAAPRDCMARTCSAGAAA
eukprot:scaffold708_cov70-Phaeocystis_antarctica.AAC.6